MIANDALWLKENSDWIRGYLSRQRQSKGEDMTRRLNPKNQPRKLKDPNVISWSDYARCASVLNVFHSSAKRPHKVKWISERELWVSQDNRVFQSIKDSKGNDYIMDSITGSLYDESGTCLSSNQLTLPPIEINKAKASKILMSISNSDTRD